MTSSESFKPCETCVSAIAAAIASHKQADDASVRIVHLERELKTVRYLAGHVQAGGPEAMLRHIEHLAAKALEEGER